MAQLQLLNNSIPEPEANEAIESAPRAGVTDWMLRGGILLGLAFVVYVTVVGRLFHPMLRAAEWLARANEKRPVTGPDNLAILEKTGDDLRPWDHHVAF